MNSSDVLREAGLSLNESKVYAALLGLGASSVQTLSIRARVHRRNTYDSLAKLVEKGLAREVFVKNERHYAPSSPQRVLDLLHEKTASIEAELPRMVAQFESKEESQQAYVYKGIQGFKSYLQDILDQKQTVYFIGAKAFWLDPRLQHFLPRFQAERKKRGIEFKHLFDYEVKTQKPEILKLVGGEYRFLPKEYSSSTAVDIFGDYVVTFVGVRPGELPAEPVQFVMKSRQLANGYRKFFQCMWDASSGR
jgi:sugar-specific transcriptional regulator TrmB